MKGFLLKNVFPSSLYVLHNYSHILFFACTQLGSGLDFVQVSFFSHQTPFHLCMCKCTVTQLKGQNYFFKVKEQNSLLYHCISYSIRIFLLLNYVHYQCNPLIRRDSPHFFDRVVYLVSHLYLRKPFSLSRKLDIKLNLDRQMIAV